MQSLYCPLYTVQKVKNVHLTQRQCSRCYGTPNRSKSIVDVARVMQRAVFVHAFGYQDFTKIEFRIKPTNMGGFFYKNYMGRIYNNNNSSSNQLFFIGEDLTVAQ